MRSKKNARKKLAISSISNLPSMPCELVLCISKQLPSEADKQALRATCNAFRALLPPPVLLKDQSSPGTLGYSLILTYIEHYPNAWVTDAERLDFLSRVYRDWRKKRGWNLRDLQSSSGRKGMK